jgi:methionyl-tRNA synthetase
MGELERFLDSLTDTELAVFIAYRYNSFLKESKEKIKSEVLERNLTNDKLNDLFNKGIIRDESKEGYFCPRCNASNYLTETDIELRQDFTSYEVAIDTNRCRICGYNPGKEKSSNLFKRMKKSLIRARGTRLTRPEIDRIKL